MLKSPVFTRGNYEPADASFDRASPELRDPRWHSLHGACHFELHSLFRAPNVSRGNDSHLGKFAAAGFRSSVLRLGIEAGVRTIRDVSGQDSGLDLGRAFCASIWVFHFFLR